MAVDDTVVPRGAGLRTVVVANPTKSADPTWPDRMLGVLERAGLPGARWVSTTAEDPGPGQARQALADGAELVVVCGGDGTVRNVVTALAGSEVPLAVLPMGTGNLLARNLGIPLDIGAAAHVAAHGHTRRIDLGRDPSGQYFAVMAGVGFDAALLAGVQPATKAWLGWPAYVLSGLRQLRTLPGEFAVDVDGVEVSHRALGVLVANVGELQGGLQLILDADPCDGRLDVAVLAPDNLRQWLHLARRVLTGRAPDEDVLRVRQGARVTIRSVRRLPLQYDGDVLPHGDVLTAEVAAGALLVRVP